MFLAKSGSKERFLTKNKELFIHFRLTLNTLLHWLILYKSKTNKRISTDTFNWISTTQKSNRFQIWEFMQSLKIIMILKFQMSQTVFQVLITTLRLISHSGSLAITKAPTLITSPCQINNPMFLIEQDKSSL